MSHRWRRGAILWLTIVCLLTLSSATRRSIKSALAREVSRSITPAPPAQRADRFGIYNWGIDYAAYPGGTLDRLNWGAEQAARLGTRTIRVAISPRDTYLVNPPGPFDLARTAASAPYDQLFRDPRFQTYLLTAYSSGDQINNWADGFSVTEYQAERDEMRRLGQYLLSNANYANKTFIILNWEGDSALERAANKRAIWDAYRDWIQSRADGIREAREQRPESAVHLYSGLEFNAVKSGQTGEPCGSPVADAIRNNPLRNRCVIDYVAPRVSVDYYSYSSWPSIGVKVSNPDASLKETIKTDLGFALAKVKAVRPEVTEAHFILGEYGFSRTEYGECRAANYIHEMIEALAAPDAFQLSYAIFWQIVDTMPLPNLGSSGHGLFKSRPGQLLPTLAGSVFQRWIAGQPMTSYRGCPLIRQWPEGGVLDSVTGETNFHLLPDSVLSIYAQGCCQSTETPFSPSGNQVHFDQGVRQYVLPRDNPAWFYESPVQINASLPAGRRPGQAFVYLTDQNGLDSNGQLIHLSCASCPQIRPSCGILDGINYTEEFFPGTVISLFGSAFSTAGNQVIVEQQDERGLIHRYVLPRDDVWYESTGQINARLPAALRTDWFAAVYVIDREGRESNEQIIFISSDCPDCAPTIRPCLGILNAAANAEGFHPGTVISIFGARFSPSGNTVIVEQGDQHSVLPRESVLIEAPTRINAVLPTGLVPGRALVYVIDARGRESNALAITIQRLIPRPRPPRRPLPPQARVPAIAQ